MDLDSSPRFPLNPRARVAVAMLVSTVALGWAYGLSVSLRHRAAQASHQLATPEDWFDQASPRSAPLVAQGRAAFLSSCAHCHAADATGDEGPDLHGLEASDRYISNTILRGIKGEMPSFKKKLGAADVGKLTAYLRSLSPD
jgi:mono/diheme cytochrome c family protein